MPKTRFAPSLIVLLLGCTTLAGGAQAWSLFGSDKKDVRQDARKPADRATADKSGMTMNENVGDGVREAQAFRLAGNYPEAIRHLSQLMMVASDDPGVVSEYGKTLAAQGRADDAINFLTRAQQLRPADWTLYSAMGVAYDQLGKHDLARAAYEAALRIRPGEASVLSNYALSRLLAKDPDTARTLIARAESAGGDSDPKIARNIALIREIAPQANGSQQVAAKPAQTPVAPQPHTPAPVARVATAPISPLQAQQAPARIAPVAAPAPAPTLERAAPPITAAPITVAAHPTKSVPSQSPAFVTLPAPRPANAAPVIQAMPVMPTAGRVVMQRVPIDPLAGPVNAPHRTATAAPRTLTAPSAPPAAAPQASASMPAAAQARNLQARAETLAKAMNSTPSAKPAAGPEVQAQSLQARAEALAKTMTAAKPAAAPVKTAAAPAQTNPVKTTPVKAAPVKTAEAPKPSAPAKTAPVKTAEAAKPKDEIPSLRMSANAY